MSRPRNRVIRLTHTKQKWATDACQTSQLSVTNLSTAAAGGRPHLPQEEAQRQERGWPPLPVLEGEVESQCRWVSSPESPGSCEPLPLLWNLASRAGKKEGKKGRKGTAPRDYGCAPDLHPMHSPSERSWELPPFLVSLVSTHPPSQKRIWGVCWGEWSACLKGSLSTWQPAEELQNKVEGVFGLRGWGASTGEVRGKGTCEGERVESGVPTESNHRQQEIQGVTKVRREKKGPERGRPKGQMHSLPTSRLQPGLTRLYKCGPPVCASHSQPQTTRWREAYGLPPAPAGHSGKGWLTNEGIKF